MIEMKHAQKVAVSWTTIVYAVCYSVVALFPGTREWFMESALHAEYNAGPSIMTVNTFVSGILIWNVIAVIAVWLFVTLHNYFK